MAEIRVLREELDACRVVGLANDAVEVRVAPKLGAKIVGLFDRRARREWMWAPSQPPRLHNNQVGDDFATSPMVGGDECIPTVAPSEVDGQPLPDHGEAWARAWSLDEHELDRGRITTAVALRVLPLRFVRRLSVDGPTVRCDYELTNTGDTPCRFAWAQHPLFAIDPADRLELSGVTRVYQSGEATGMHGVEADAFCDWPVPVAGTRLDRLDLGGNAAAIKLFAHAPGGGAFRIANDKAGSLNGRFGPTEELPYLAIWITRGGWNGQHNFALEPTNVMADAVADVDPVRHPQSVIEPGRIRRWFVAWTLC